MNITRQGDTFVIARADGRTCSVSYNTTDPAEIRAHAVERRELAARALRQAEYAEAVATYLDAEAVKQAERDAEKRKQAAEQAKRTRERNEDPWGFLATTHEQRVWEAFDTISDDAERREHVNRYVRTCSELNALCKQHKISPAMQAGLMSPRDGSEARTIVALRKRGLIDGMCMPTDLGRRIGALAQERLALRSCMRQDMLTEIP